MLFKARKVKNPDPLPLNLMEALMDAAVDTAKELTKEKIKHGATDAAKELAMEQIKHGAAESANWLSSTLVQEAAAQAVGITGRLIISAVLRSVDDTARKLKILEGDVRFLMWEPILDGARIAREEINAPISKERQPFSDGRLHTALSRLGQAKHHYEHMGIDGKPMFDLKLLIAFVTLQATGGRLDARKLFQEIAGDLRRDLKREVEKLTHAKTEISRMERLLDSLRRWQEENKRVRWTVDLPTYVKSQTSGSLATQGNIPNRWFQSQKRLES